jgi:hypothetical protein
MKQLPVSLDFFFLPPFVVQQWFFGPDHSKIFNDRAAILA